MTDYGMRRPYTASGPEGQQDRVNFNLQRAESLLDEPETGFSLGGATPGGYGGGFGAGYSQGITSGAGRIGTGRTGGLGGRSNYTASEFGEDDTHSQIQQKPSWLGGGNQPTLGGGNFGGNSLAGVTEIGTVDFAGSRRSGRFAGGNTSQASGSAQNQNQGRLRPGLSNSGYGGDFLDNEMNKNDGMSRQRSTNLLSDAGSKAGYREDDDLMSHYMGQSAYGGASNIGMEVGSNAGERFAAHQHSTQQAETGSRSRSRRQEVAERNNLNIGSSGIPDSRRNDRLTAGQKPPETRNYGLFLGGAGSAQGDKQSEGVRSRSEHTRLQGADHGVTIGSNDSQGGFKRPDTSNLPTGFQRERSFPPTRPVPFDVQKEDAASTHSKEPVKSHISSPSKTDAISIVDNKKEYLKQKKKKDLEALQAELDKEKSLLSQTDDEFQKQIELLKEKQQKELESVEQNHKETIALLSKEKDKIMGTLHEAVEREHNKMEQLHRADLDSKDKLHQENLQSLKTQLQKETDALEAQLNQQQELREIIERVQKRTVDIGEIVQSSLRQREDELKRKEIDTAKLERDMLEDETIHIELEEKKLAEEERKLQARKDVLLKLKQTQNEEVNSMRRQRQNALENNQKDEARLRQEEREAKEQLVMAKKTIDQENERRSAQNRLFEVEIQNKESELQNANQLFEKEKQELEQEQRENYIREIQARQIEIEDRKKILANNQHELRREQRMLEKKRELIEADTQELEEKKAAFVTEKLEFEVQAQRIQETSEKLQEEGARVWEEKAVFDADKEQLDQISHDINIERSLLQAELLKAEELEHELIHRENMLKMLQFNKDNKEKATCNQGILPAYTSCPNLKMDNQQVYIQTLSPGGEHFDRQHVAHAPQMQEYNMLDPAMQYSDFQANRFDYNRYMQELQNKLGSNTMFSGDRNWSKALQNNINAQVNEFGHKVGYHCVRGNIQDVMSEDNQHLSPSNIRPGIEVQNQQLGNSICDKSGRDFREKILAQLGRTQLEDSKFNSNSEGYQEEAEMSGVMYNQMHLSQGERSNFQNMVADMGYDSEM